MFKIVYKKIALICDLWDEVWVPNSGKYIIAPETYVTGHNIMINKS